jgi:hypothetical protein
MNKNFRIEFEDDDLLPTRGDEGEDAGGEGGGGGKEDNEEEEQKEVELMLRVLKPLKKFSQQQVFTCTCCLSTTLDTA